MKNSLEDFETELMSSKELKDYIKDLKRKERYLTIFLILFSVIAILLAIAL